MNLAELTESMHATHAPGGPDLERVRRQGRRIVVRRRAGVTASVAVIAALVATPFAVTHGGADRASTAEPADAPTPEDDATRFETTAPMGAPAAAVIEPGMKFYVGDRMRSVGSLALWGEGQDGDVAYGARLIDGDGTLRRAGTMAVPLLGRGGVPLVRVPGQNANEPTFVGLLPLPAGTGVIDGYRIRVTSTDTLVHHGFDAQAVPGRLLVWVTATEGGRPGIDVADYVVRSPAGDVIARGGFAPSD